MNSAKLILFLSLFGLGFATAQEKILLGVNAGGTYSNIRGNEFEDFKYGANFLVGITAEFKLNDKFSLLTNLNFERKSFSQDLVFQPFDPFDYDPAFTYGIVQINYTYSYLSIPINVKYYLGSKNNFFINGGFYSAFLLSSNSKIEGEKQPRYRNNVFTADLGLNAGAGYVFRLNDKNNLNVELRDNLGLAGLINIITLNSKQTAST